MSRMSATRLSAASSWKNRLSAAIEFTDPRRYKGALPGSQYIDAPEKPKPLCHGDIHRASLQVGAELVGANEGTYVERYADRHRATKPPAAERAGRDRKGALAKPIRGSLRTTERADRVVNGHSRAASGVED